MNPYSQIVRNGHLNLIFLRLQMGDMWKWRIIGYYLWKGSIWIPMMFIAWIWHVLIIWWIYEVRTRVQNCGPYTLSRVDSTSTKKTGSKHVKKIWEIPRFVNISKSERFHTKQNVSYGWGLKVFRDFVCLRPAMLHYLYSTMTLPSSSPLSQFKYNAIIYCDSDTVFWNPNIIQLLQNKYSRQKVRSSPPIKNKDGVMIRSTSSLPKKGPLYDFVIADDSAMARNLTRINTCHYRALPNMN